MAKTEKQSIAQHEVATIPSGAMDPKSNMMELPKTLTPAAVVGVNSMVQIAQENLPEEFQGQELETLQTGFAPTVKWVNPGNFVGGVFVNFEEDQGPNHQRVYNFVTKKDAKPFGVWGSTVLDRSFDMHLAIGKIKPGSLVMITYMGDIQTDQQPCRMFHLAVAKVKASS